MFNSLKYAKKLEEVGFTREQAETHVQIMVEIIDTNLATQQNLKDLESSLRQEMKDIRHEMVQLESRLTIKLGAIVSVAIGIAVALTKLV